MTALQRNNLRWEAQKAAIQEFYIHKDHTLRDTMEHFQQSHCFKASERKWKDKLKEWAFEKNVPSKEMYFMVAKAEKRKIEEGKLTLFARAGITVDKCKVEQFKKRRLASGYDVPVIPETPPQVTYYTPKPPSPDFTPINESDLQEELRTRSSIRDSNSGGDESDETPNVVMSPTVVPESPIDAMDLDGEPHHPMETSWTYPVGDIKLIHTALAQARHLRYTNQRRESDFAYLKGMKESFDLLLSLCPSTSESWLSDVNHRRIIPALEAYITEFQKYMLVPTSENLALARTHYLNLYEMSIAIKIRGNGTRWSTSSMICQFQYHHLGLIPKQYLDFQFEDIRPDSKIKIIRRVFEGCLNRAVNTRDGHISGSAYSRLLLVVFSSGFEKLLSYDESSGPGLCQYFSLQRIADELCNKNFFSQLAQNFPGAASCPKRLADGEG